MKKFMMLMLVVLLGSCDKDSSTNVPQYNTKGSLGLYFDKSATPQGVSVITATLSREGHESIVKTLNLLSDSTADIIIENIAVGTWKLKVDATDELNHVLYTGQTNVTVIEGTVTQVNLVLQPVASGVGSVEINVSWGTSNKDIIAHYPLSGNARDQSDNNYHGTVSGALLTSDRFGNADSAYMFDGVDDYIVSTPPLPVSNEVRSISAWFNTTSNTGSGGYYANTVFSWGGTAENSLCAIAIYEGELIFNAITTQADVWTGIKVNDGKWHHVVVVYNGSVLKMYLDNNLIVSVNRILNTQSSSFYLGKRANQINENMGGLIDDVRIYNRMLSGSEINSLYHEGGWQ